MWCEVQAGGAQPHGALSLSVIVLSSTYYVAFVNLKEVVFQCDIIFETSYKSWMAHSIFVNTFNDIRTPYILYIHVAQL